MSPIRYFYETRNYSQVAKGIWDKKTEGEVLG
jgi:hypothetical protein